MMAEERTSWRGRIVAPRTPREAWVRFGTEVGLVLTIVAGIAAIVILTDDGDTLRPKLWLDYFWINLMAVVLVPLVLGYEIWLLRRRLQAFAKGEVFVDDDEVSPDAVPAASKRKRRETPAQARRRKAFWRELILVTVVWLFCAGLFGWVTVTEWIGGRSAGVVGKVFLLLLVLYPVYVILSVSLKNDKDRGR